MKSKRSMRTAQSNLGLAAANSANYFKMPSIAAAGHPLGLGAAGPQHAALQG